MTSIRNNLQQVRDRITTACARAGRSADSVQLLAVSKTMPLAHVLDAMAAGQTAFGENYVQEGVQKVEALRAWEAEGGGPGRAQWHLIGPLQSNKTRLVAAHFDWVHSVDRLKIAERLAEQRPQELASLQVCIQVNIDGGASKSGVAPEDTLALARAVAALPRLVLRGLMTIPEPVAGFEAQRAVHARARALFEQVRDAGVGPAFDTLSMGMTADLEAAIDAGSTLVRVGTAIFGAR
ncbi:YggS family pyridoxal phosphate-dependent enzyme [Pseudorhodoferax sp.]|uniref:YggS family pyridoxal phosphate-dependent enzyme n=1 Tax=Pseudorhodoferax sp. TaxID=1993553 RepID=UPI002DD66B7C|nr:YggS family pyridoxal phosphate-dependent enzyme [Pseudorhodoferax sp.]